MVYSDQNPGTICKNIKVTYTVRGEQKGVEEVLRYTALIPMKQEARNRYLSLYQRQRAVEIGNNFWECDRLNSRL